MRASGAFSAAFVKALWGNRRAWIGWTLALTGIATMYAAFWPSIGNSPELVEGLDSYPDVLKEAFNFEDYSDPASYLASAVYGLLVPVLLASMAISVGMKAIAGDEEAGTLDLVMAHPIRRTALALARMAAIVVGLGVITLAIAIAVTVLRVPADFAAVSVGNIFTMSAQLAFFGVFFAAVSFAVGAATGRKAAAIGVGASVAVFAYLADSFLKQIDALAWTENFSPFEWYLGGEPLKNGIDWGGAGLLVGLSVVLLVVGVWRFNRRDVGV